MATLRLTSIYKVNNINFMKYFLSISRITCMLLLLCTAFCYRIPITNIFTFVNSTSPLLGSFCGTSRPYPVYSSGRYLRVTLQGSDTGMHLKHSFKAQYNVIDSKPTIQTGMCVKTLIFTIIFLRSVSCLYSPARNVEKISLF